jgi:PhnB protein
MPVQKLNPYLQFNGNAAKAIELYERALGATVESVMRHGDMPNASGKDKDLIMHAALRIGGGELMLSDHGSATQVGPEKNVHVALHLDDVAEAEKMFAALSAGGTITQPFVDTFWGAKFGMLVDPFGIQWMFNCEMKKQGA